MTIMLLIALAGLAAMNIAVTLSLTGKIDKLENDLSEMRSDVDHLEIVINDGGK